MKKIGKNLSRALCIIIYFIILFFAYTRMNLDRLAQDIQVFSGAFLVLGILALEKAYKKDSGEVAITGIELLALSIHSLSIMHMITLLKYDFKSYMLISSGIVVIYYVLKVIIIYTKDKKEYLKGLSDISKIVKEKEETDELESTKENQSKETNNTEIKQNKDSKTKTNSKRKQAKKVNESKNKEKPKTKAKSNKKVIEDKTEKQSKETKTETKKKKIENVEEKTKNEKRKKSSSVKTKKVEKEVKEND